MIRQTQVRTLPFNSCMWPCAAVYGFVLALAGVRLAAEVATGKMPELCQVAVRSQMT